MKVYLKIIVLNIKQIKVGFLEKQFVLTECSKRPTPVKPTKLLIGGLRQFFYFYFLDGIILQNSSERKVKKTNIELIQNIINPSPSEGDFY